MIGNRKLSRWLVRYVEQRDVEALACLFDATSAELLRVARHLCRDAGEAEDLVQATFLALLEHPERYDRRSSALAWMVAILTKEAQAFARRARRRPDAERALEGARRREEAERPARLADDAEGALAVRSALARVPELYRGVLERHLFGGQAPAEIASEVGRSAGTVRVQLHRGLHHLRQLLPEGLAGGLALTIIDRSATRGLAAVRTEILREAAAGSGTIPSVALSTVSAGTLLNGLVMAKKTLLALSAVVAVSALWVLQREPVPLAPELWRGDGEVRLTELDTLAAELADGPPLDAAPRTAPDQGDGHVLPLGPRLRVRTIFADGEEAPLTSFQTLHFRPGSPVRNWRTNDQGLCVLEDLEPGLYALYGDRGGHATVQLIAPRVDDGGSALGAEERATLSALVTTEATLRIPRGHDVVGRVVDGDGRPVAGAEVWITAAHTRSSGTEVARSAEDGSFTVRQLGADCFLGARAESLAPSRPLYVAHLFKSRGGPQEGAPLDVELVLPERGARVRGILRDPEGQPVANARVRLGAQNFYDTYGPTGAEGPPPPVEVRTDEQGAFEADGLAPGRVDVACVASGYPAQTASVEVRAGETRAVDVTLEAAAWVRGRVLDPSDVPVANVDVNAWRQSWSIGGARSSFREPHAVSADDGTFVLGPLASGAITLHARTSDGSLRAEGTLQVLAGQTYQWSLVLTELPAVQGRAFDVDGAPLVGWTVAVHPIQRLGLPHRRVMTGADGSFSASIAADAVRLELYPPEVSLPGAKARTWFAPRPPLAWLEDVPVPSEDVRLVLDPLQRPTARLTGELADPAGVGIDVAVAKLTHVKFGAIGQFVLVPGHGPFEFAGLPAGPVELTIEAGRYAPLRLSGIRVEHGEVKDLGRLTPAPAGALILELVDAEGRGLGSSPADLLVELRDPSGASAPLSREGPRWSADRLHPGTYRVEVQAPERATLSVPVEVRPGETLTESLTLSPGGPLGLVFLDADGQPFGSPILLTIEDGTGGVVFERDLASPSHWLRAPYGTLRIRALARDGRVAEASLDFDGSTPSDVPTRLTLR